jgi:1,4-alpha-glucan branching enzyme
MTEILPGMFEVEIESRAARCPRYRLVCSYDGGGKVEREDPYAHRELLTDYDLYLLGEGTHYDSYLKMGAHPENRGGVDGVRFAVWAPNAKALCIMGDFNWWDRASHPMQLHEGTGIWQLFIPGIGPGALYKYCIRLKNGDSLEKIDPYGFYFEEPPRTASVVFDLGEYSWEDSDWMEARDNSSPLDKPLSVYEVHLGSWKTVLEEGGRSLTYRELADVLVTYVKDLGFTHLELMPITEHPFSGSWGYQTTGYFAPTSRYGDPDDFRYFVDRCHQEGLGVILDWVPAHFPRDMHGLAYFDGSHLYEHQDPRQGAHPDWGTLIFNYDRNEVRNFLLSSALFWLNEYHVDGLRVDAVASMLYLDYSREDGEWIPNEYGGNENLGAIEFLKKFNELVHESHPGVMTLAEESTAWPSVSRPVYLGGLGFTLKWNMGWMHDSLSYISLDPVYRRYHHDKLTFSLLYAFSENFVLPLSHDEVVHGKQALLSKMPGDGWQKFSNLRLFFSYMFGHPGKKLLFMGAEFGQWNEWNYQSSLDWHLLDWEGHRALLSFVKELNRIYTREAALFEVDFDWNGFQWLDSHDSDNSAVAFLRRAKNGDDLLICAFNFTPVPRSNYRLGVPAKAFYREILNSDATAWGGSNVGNLGGVEAGEFASHGQPYSIEITLPPLGGVFFRPDLGVEEHSQD